MPYFDSRTYKINSLLHDRSSLLVFAREFYSICERDGQFPREVLMSEKEALTRQSLNELIIMADATTGYALHMEDAYNKALQLARTSHDQYILICITLAALYTYRCGTYNQNHDASLKRRVLIQIKEFEKKYGKDDLSFVPSFIEHRTQRMQAVHEAYMARAQEEAEKRKQKEALEAERSWQRHMERLEKKRRIAEQRKERRLQVDEARQVELNELQGMPLSEKLKTVVSNRKTPGYYGIDYAAISDSELKSVSKDLLSEVASSFRTVKDPSWKELRRKARQILTD